MKCELKYMYHIQKKLFTEIYLRREWKSIAIFTTIGMILWYFWHWIGLVILGILFICLYYEAHIWCRNKDTKRI